MKSLQILFGVALVTLLFAADSAQAIPPGTCDLVLDFKLTAYQQQSVNVNDPPGSDTYKTTIAKIKITTADLIEQIADAAVLPHPPAGTRLAIYTDGFYEGSACFLDENGDTVSGFSAISAAIFEEVISTTTPVLEEIRVATPTGSRKGKAWLDVIFGMNFLTSNLDLTGFASDQTKVTPSTSTYSIKIDVHGPGQIDGATTFFFGKVSGKGPVGL